MPGWFPACAERSTARTRNRTDGRAVFILDARHRCGLNEPDMSSRCALLDLDQVTSPSVRAFERYWSVKGHGAIPRRSAIDPLEIPNLLPLLVIADLESAPFRVRYRLVGTRVVESHGTDYTNRYLDECGFLIEVELTECYRRLTETRAPVFMYYEWERKDWPRDRGRIGASETGFFPLSSDGAGIFMAISIADPDVPPRHLTILG